MDGKFLNKSLLTLPINLNAFLNRWIIQLKVLGVVLSYGAVQGGCNVESVNEIFRITNGVTMMQW